MFQNEDNRGKQNVGLLVRGFVGTAGTSGSCSGDYLQIDKRAPFCGPRKSVNIRKPAKFMKIHWVSDWLNDGGPGFKLKINSIGL